MSYTAIDTAVAQTKQQIKVALVKQAALRSSAAAVVATQATNPDPRERDVCRDVISGSMPDSWITMVLIVLDIAGFLAAPTDAQVDTVLVTGITTPATVAPVWQFLIATR